MPHWVYAGIHLYLHLPAIHAYTYSNCNSHSDTYGQTNTHAQARDNTEGTSYPTAASGRGARMIRSRSPLRPSFGVAPRRTSWYLAIDFENYRRSPRWRGRHRQHARRVS